MEPLMAVQFPQDGDVPPWPPSEAAAGRAEALADGPPQPGDEGECALWCVAALHEGRWLLVCVSASVERTMERANVARERFRDEVEIFTLAPLHAPAGIRAAV